MPNNDLTSPSTENLITSRRQNQTTTGKSYSPVRSILWPTLPSSQDAVPTVTAPHPQGW